jgi:glutamate synthase (NADPH/NADH) large chain
MAVLPRGIREIEMTKYDADWVAAETAKRAWMAENGMYSEAEEHAS